jgi:IclR family mhp operon transcriptional activator
MPSPAAAASYPSVRSLVRGLGILQALSAIGEGSSGQLAQMTGIPRSTAHRLLETLSALGFVQRAGLRDTYRLTSLVYSISDGHQPDDWISEIAGPIIQDLQEALAWPVSIATYHDAAMVLRINTHRGNPLSLVRARPGTRLPMLSSSMGRAYLAWCGEHERYWILRLIAAGDPAFTPQIETLTRRMLDETRERGYALRHRGKGERTSSIAVPIREGDKVHACMNVEWIHSALPMSKAIELVVEPLQQCASRISAEYALKAASRKIQLNRS